MKAVCVRADPDYGDSSVIAVRLRCLPRRTEQLVVWWARGDAPVGAAGAGTSSSGALCFQAVEVKPMDVQKAAVIPAWHAKDPD